MNTAELIDEAKSLPMEARARLVDSLLQTLNPVDDANTTAWTTIARNRLADLDSGRIKAVPGDEVFQRATGLSCA